MSEPTPTPTPVPGDQKIRNPLLAWIWIILGSFVAFGILTWVTFQYIKKREAKQNGTLPQGLEQSNQIHLEVLRTERENNNQDWVSRVPPDDQASVSSGWAPPAYYSPVDGRTE